MKICKKYMDTFQPTLYVALSLEKTDKVKPDDLYFQLAIGRGVLIRVDAPGWGLTVEELDVSKDWEIIRLVPYSALDALDWAWKNMVPATDDISEIAGRRNQAKELVAFELETVRELRKKEAKNEPAK